MGTCMVRVVTSTETGAPGAAVREAITAVRSAASVGFTRRPASAQ